MKKAGTKKKQAKKQNKSAKISKTWVVSGVLLLVLAGLITYQKVIIPNQEKAKFASLNNERERLSADLKEYLGPNLNNEKNDKYCFRAEQGPFDNGKIWCQTATTIEINNEIEFDSISKRFEQRLSTNPKCHIAYVNSAGKQQGTIIMNPANTKPPYIFISCADRSATNIY